MVILRQAQAFGSEDFDGELSRTAQARGDYAEQSRSIMMTRKKHDQESKKLQARIKELEDSWKRALADYQNLEKRIVQEKEKFAKFANSELILKILPAIDDLEKAENHLKDEGLSLALGNLRQRLQEAGLAKIEVKGKKFDPEEMECVEIGRGEEGKVIEEIRPGYKLNDRVLRPAQVKVGKQKIDERKEKILKEELLRGGYV